MNDTLKTVLAAVIAQSGIIGIITAAVAAKMKKSKEEQKALFYGVQAILRHELYSIYTDYCCNKKYAPVYVKEDFENMYKQYHSLGANGVMDSIREEFQKLPNQPEGD